MFLKNWSWWSNSVARQVNFDRTKIGGKYQNSNETFWVIFNQCESQKSRFRSDFLTDFFWQGVRRFANWQFSPGRKGKFKAKFWHKRNYGNGIFWYDLANTCSGSSSMSTYWLGQLSKKLMRIFTIWRFLAPFFRHENAP